MNELLEILKELHPDVDYENCTTLIDDKILDSFDIVSIISEVSDSFDVAIPAEDSLTISDEPLTKQCPMYFQSTVNFLNESFVSLNMKYAPPASITVTSPATFAYAAPLSPISRGPIRT